MNILIIGGTRNMGHLLALALLEAGHQVTVFNRGLTTDNLPEAVIRLRGDRTIRAELSAALQAADYDIVVDMVLFTGAEAETIVELLTGRVQHYIFVSSGQVYLIREGLKRPFSEEDYDGPLMPPPKANTYGNEEWHYGKGKRDAEDVLARAWKDQSFPYTSLRLPMVNGEREPFNRLYGYMLRIKDGGPVLVPDTPQHPLRHIDAQDVVRAMLRLIDAGVGKGSVYNISQDETVMLPEFVDMMCAIMGRDRPELISMKRRVLEANGFLPDCSPFSDRWMSELTNDLSKSELGMTYTPLAEYLTRIIHYYEKNPPRRPASYRRRSSERNFAVQADQQLSDG
jgi:nucleoside-diphosphate-sugar epimerase